MFAYYVVALLSFGSTAEAATLSLDLITDGGNGNMVDDGVVTGTVRGRGTGYDVAVEVFGTGITTAVQGVVLRFEFDKTLLKLIKGESQLFALTLPEGDIGFNFASTSPVNLAPSGFIARVEFATLTDVSNRTFTIGIEKVTIAESATSSKDFTSDAVITFNKGPSADFDGDGEIAFPDFLAFAGSFGTSQGDPKYNAQFDLNSDGEIGFTDFLLFAEVFGTRIESDPPPPTPVADTTNYDTLTGLQVSPGRVRYLFFSAGRCINLTNSTINSTTYTVHWSKWQKKVSGGWADIEGTRQTGICSLSPTETGEYRLVVEISINGRKGQYISENSIVVS